MIHIDKTSMQVSGTSGDLMVEWHMLTSKLYETFIEHLEPAEVNEMFTRGLFAAIDMATHGGVDKFIDMMSNIDKLATDMLNDRLADRDPEYQQMIDDLFDAIDNDDNDDDEESDPASNKEY